MIEWMCLWGWHRWNYVPMPRHNKPDADGRYCQHCGKVEYKEDGYWKSLR
jgi:hypothetical protein